MKRKQKRTQDYLDEYEQELQEDFDELKSLVRDLGLDQEESLEEEARWIDEHQPWELD